MRFKTASIAMLAAVLLPASSPFAMRTPGVDAHALALPVALSPTTEVTMTFDAWRFDGSWTVVVFCPQRDGAPAFSRTLKRNIPLPRSKPTSPVCVTPPRTIFRRRRTSPTSAPLEPLSL